jgi:phosphate starvation-inducible PhoH-like protein
MKLSIKLDNIDDVRNIVGIHNQNLKMLEEVFNIQVDVHGDQVLTDTDDSIILAKLEDIFQILKFMAENQQSISPRDVIYIENIVSTGKKMDYINFLKERKPLCHTQHNKPIYAKTLKQNEYLKCLKSKDLIFSIGAAGTGKTYLAVCYAVSELKKGTYEKIILTRPAVEAGESLGFLPGDLKEKVDPYLRPLYDALYEIMGAESVMANQEKGLIEVAPLAYMRGRTLDNAFIILDEAQNTTQPQMKMFLTRIGFNSKVVVTGDRTQKDLPKDVISGLSTAEKVLKNVEGISFIELTSKDVVRHPLVAKIIDAYDKYEDKQKK